MTKAELIEKIAKSRNLSPDVSKKLIQQILDLAFDELGSYFVRARVTKSSTPRFTYPGFGTFTKKKRSARKGVNPRTLEPMQIDASFTVDFRPGVELKSGLNGATSKPVKATKAKSTKAKAKVRDEGEAPKVEDAGRRRLRSRDEVELESYDADYDPSLFGDDAASLPEAPMQRVRGRRAKVKDVG
ncbi:MAG: HU family DNA-binding protein [Myxococcales bacterium]|nr:HU family DNA-binding protein [Myxococcales bacterium]